MYIPPEYMKSNEYVRIVNNPEDSREVMSGIDNEYLKELKYELIIDGQNTNGMFRLVNEYDIKIYSLIIYDCVYSDRVMEEIKKHPLEIIGMEKVCFGTRKKYYEFMKFLHSVKTLKTIVIRQIIVEETNDQETNDQEVYEPIDKSYVKNIHMDTYSEFVLERSTVSSLEKLSVCMTVFHHCDISLYVNKVKELNIHIFIDNIDYKNLLIEGIIQERLRRFVNKVNGVKRLNYNDYNSISDISFFDLLNNNQKNLKYIKMINGRTLMHTIEFLRTLGIVLDELQLQDYNYTVFEELYKSKVVRSVSSINDHIKSCNVEKFLNGDIGPLSVISSYVNLNDFVGIEKIKKIYFKDSTYDCYFEILKRPENNVREINVAFDTNTDNFRKLLESLKSEHCKVSSISIYGKVCGNHLLEILEIMYKKLILLRVNRVFLQYDTDNPKLLNYLLNSNIEDLHIELDEFETTAEDLVKLVTKTKKIHIYGIVLIGGSIDDIFYNIPDERIINEEFSFFFTSGISLHSHSNYRYPIRENRKNSFKLKILMNRCAPGNFIKRVLSKIDNGEQVTIEDNLVESIVQMPKDVINEILRRV